MRLSARLVLAGVCLMTLISPCWGVAVVTLANQTQFTWPNTTAAQTVTIPATTIGNLVVVIFGKTSIAANTVTPSNGGVTSWNRADTSNTNSSVDMWSGIATSSVTTITLTASAGATTDTAQILEFASTTGWVSPPLGVHAPNNGVATNPVPTASITPAENNDLIVAGVCHNKSFSSGPGAPWSNVTNVSKTGAAWQQQGTAASISTSWTLSGTAAFDTVIAAFKPTASSAFTGSATDRMLVSDSRTQLAAHFGVDTLSVLAKDNTTQFAAHFAAGSIPLAISDLPSGIRGAVGQASELFRSADSPSGLGTHFNAGTIALAISDLPSRSRGSAQSQVDALSVRESPVVMRGAVAVAFELLRLADSPSGSRGAVLQVSEVLRGADSPSGRRGTSQLVSEFLRPSDSPSGMRGAIALASELFQSADSSTGLGSHFGTSRETISTNLSPSQNAAHFASDTLQALTSVFTSFSGLVINRSGTISLLSSIDSAAGMGAHFAAGIISSGVASDLSSRSRGSAQSQTDTLLASISSAGSRGALGLAFEFLRQADSPAGIGGHVAVARETVSVRELQSQLGAHFGSDTLQTLTSAFTSFSGVVINRAGTISLLTLGAASGLAAHFGNSIDAGGVRDVQAQLGAHFASDTLPLLASIASLPRRGVVVAGTISLLGSVSAAGFGSHIAAVFDGSLAGDLAASRLALVRTVTTALSIIDLAVGGDGARHYLRLFLESVRAFDAGVAAGFPWDPVVLPARAGVYLRTPSDGVYVAPVKAGLYHIGFSKDGEYPVLIKGGIYVKPPTDLVVTK